MNPHLWNLSRYIEEPEIIKRFEKLPPLRQYQLIYLIGGETSPMFEFYLQRNDFAIKRRKCDVNEEMFLQIIPRRYEPGYKYRVARNRIISRIKQPLYRKVHGNIIIDYGRGEQYALPKLVEKILPLCDGRNNLEQIIRNLCRQERFSFKQYKKDLIIFIRRLFSPPVRLLVTKICPGCHG